jgi:hypothetical protein
MKVKKIFLVFLLLIYCSSPPRKEANVLEYVENKYNKKFEILQRQKSPESGNWKKEDLLLRDIEKDFNFSAIYDYTKQKVIWEDYKNALWNYRITKEIDKQSSLKSFQWEVRIHSENKLNFQTMDLNFTENYEEILPSIKNPRLQIKIYTEWETVPLDNLLKLGNIFQKYIAKGFEKVTIIVYVKNNKKFLSWKQTKHHPTLLKKDFLFLLELTDEKRKKAEEIFLKALMDITENQIGSSILALESLVKQFDSPFKYDPYIFAESFYVYESLYYLSRIYIQTMQREKSLATMKTFLERMDMQEVPLDYATKKQDIIRWTQN